MQDCRKTSALSEVLRRSLLRHELSAVTFESKRKRVQIEYIRVGIPFLFINHSISVRVLKHLRLPASPLLFCLPGWNLRGWYASKRKQPHRILMHFWNLCHPAYRKSRHRQRNHRHPLCLRWDEWCIPWNDKIPWYHGNKYKLTSHCRKPNG